MIYKMHADGHPYKDIIQKLEDQGYKPRNKKTWPKSSISEILRKHCYSGTHYFNTRKRKELGKRIHLRDEKDKSEWIAIKVPQIIDEETFSSVKEKMGRRKFKISRRKTTQILSGLLVCGKCGQPYKIIDYYRGKYPYYRYSTKATQGKKACNSRNLRGDEIDKAIMEEATSIIFSKENLAKYRGLIDESVKDEKKELQNLLNRLMKEQKEIDKKKAVYYQGLETGKLDMDLVAGRLKELKSQEEKITQQSLEAEERFLELPETKHYIPNKKEYQELKESLQVFIEEATPQQKRLFLSKFIHSITVHPDKITVEYYPPTFTGKKSPDSKRQGFLELDLASPTGFEPVLPA